MTTNFKKSTKESTKSAEGKSKSVKGFTEEERAAMKERAQELIGGKTDGEKAVLAKIAEMKGSDRILGEKLHKIIRANAPTLLPKTWYGMPAYATKEGRIVCFFQNAGKFKARYATLGFGDVAKLDTGNVWPASYAVTKLTTADEAMIAALVKKAVG